MSPMVVPCVMGYLALINLLTFVLCGTDKRRARRGQWRISEATLLILGLLGGCFGLYLAMIAFHHKTEHVLFKVVVLLEAFGWFILGIYLITRDYFGGK